MVVLCTYAAVTSHVQSIKKRCSPARHEEEVAPLLVLVVGADLPKVDVQRHGGGGGGVLQSMYNIL